MTVAIPDLFDNVTQLTNYDTPYDNQPIPPAFLSNTHVDVRIFDTAGLTRPRQMVDLETTDPEDPGSPWEMDDLDGETMTQIETVQVVPGEHWTVSGTGAVITNIQPQSTYNDWRAMKATCNGSTLDAIFLSDWPSGSTGAESNISTMDTLSVIIDDSGLTNTNKVNTVTMTLNSDSAGTFGNGHDSAAITMTKSGKNWTAAISGITGSCDLTKVTGLKIEIKDDTTHHPANNDVFYVFAIRGYKTGYDPSVSFDVNTRRNALYRPVTLDLALTSSRLDLVRGTTSNSATDPRPLDEEGRLIIKRGNLTVATGGTYNSVDFLFREDRTNQVYSLVRFEFNGAGARWSAIQSASSVNTTVVSNQAIPGGKWTTILASSYFIVDVSLQGYTLTVTLYTSDGNEEIQTQVYQKQMTVSQFTPTRGRMGYGAQFHDFDIYLQQYNGFPLAFSTLLMEPALSLTPVDGVSLTASYSEDSNLFNSFSGNPQPVIDTQLTLSGLGSFQTPGPIQSNLFLIDNFDQAYLEFDMWVPGQVTSANQPRVVMRSPASVSDVVFPVLNLQGNQWNHISIDLAETQALDGIPYQVYLERVAGQGTTYLWNVDNFIIGVRNVAWMARANPTDPWVAFRDTVNNATGAVHFHRDHRGSQLQVQAVALTVNAWIGPFSYAPHYAELGRPIYNYSL